LSEVYVPRRCRCRCWPEEKNTRGVKKWVNVREREKVMRDHDHELDITTTSMVRLVPMTNIQERHSTLRCLPKDSVLHILNGHSAIFGGRKKIDLGVKRIVVTCRYL
jgi:hypothetical protein